MTRCRMQDRIDAPQVMQCSWTLTSGSCIGLCQSSQSLRALSFRSQSDDLRCSVGTSSSESRIIEMSTMQGGRDVVDGVKNPA